MRPRHHGSYRSANEDSLLLGETVSKIVRGSGYTKKASEIWESCVQLMEPILNNRNEDIYSCQCILKMRRILDYVKHKNPENQFVDDYISKWNAENNKAKCWELYTPIISCAVEVRLLTEQIHCRQYYIKKIGDRKEVIIDTPLEGEREPTAPIEV